jgi:peptidoglycan/xylan/chitin deacetylase (PgdA/CDA1 family)
MKAMPAARLGMWAFAATGITLGARAMLAAPPPLGPTLLGFGSYCALGTLGVFWPERGMYGSVLSRGSHRPELALTFDDGPSPKTTPRVLSILAEHGAKACFFVMGRKALAHPQLLREIVAAGHELGLHGYEHDRLFSLRGSRYVRDDIARTQAAIAAAGVTAQRWFRPPIGFVSHLTVWGARAADVTLVGASTRAFDGFASANSTRVASRLVAGASPGAILALHDASEHDDYVPASLEALPTLLAAIAERRLACVTLSSLTGAEESA